ncbi:MAG: hypothetical protein HOP15_12470 [Planctomycetes bacterium]|nr:hypothetical protein [Planctomycetota bacterium]
MTRGEGYDASDVLGFQLSPDGMWAAFFADPDGDDRMELFGVPVDASESPRRLNGPLVAGGHLVEVQYWDGFPIFDEPWLAIGSGNRVVYRGDQDTDGVIELFSAPIDGSEPPVKIGGPNASFDLCLLTPDGTRALFVADPEGDDVFDLYSSPIDGSAPPTRVNGPLVPGASFDPSESGLAVSPDSTTVVYRVDALTIGVYELFAAPVAGGSAPVRISAPMVAGGDVQPGGLQISPAGGRVVYVADAASDESYFVWSAPLDGSAAPVQLGNSLGSGHVAARSRVSITPDGSRVVYQPWHSGVYSVPITGGPAVLLGQSQWPDGGSDTRAMEISPDGARVVCLADWRDGLNRELFSMPIDGGTPPVVLNGDIVFGGQVEEFVISPTGDRLVYRASQDTYGVEELYSVPLDGGAPAVKLNAPLPASASVIRSPRITPDGAFVLFPADASVSGRFELWRVPIGGGVVPQRLNGAMVYGGDVCEELLWTDVRHGYDVTPDGMRVVYRADQRIDETLALWSVPSDRSTPPRELSGELEPGPVLGDVMHFAWADGRCLLYSADQEVDGRFEVYSAELDAASTRIPVRRLGEGLTFSPSPDGAQVAFTPPRHCIFYPPSCWSVAPMMCSPVDGSAPAWNVSLGLLGYPTGFAFDPSSSRLVFAFEVEHEGFRARGLFSAGMDDHVVTSLTEPSGMLEYTEIGEPVLAPAGSRVIFSQQDWVPQGGSGLWCALLDRSQPPMPLIYDTAAGFRAYQVTATSVVVVFVADLELAGTFELFRVPLDGSGPPVRLGPPLPGHADVDPAFLLAPDGERVFYLADLSADGALELWTVPLDPFRGSEVVRLSAKPVPGGSVAPGVFSTENGASGYHPQFALAPDGTRVVYRADQDIDGVFELYSARSDGQGTPVKLNAPLGPGESVPPFGFVVHPGGESVLFVAPDPAGALRPFTVPIGGGEPPLPLGGAFVEGGGLWLAPSMGAALSFALTPDATRVVYLADQRRDETFELFVAPLDGSLSGRALNSPLAPGGNVGSTTGSRSFAISPDGTRVAYLADQDVDEVFELFVSYLHLERRPLRPGRL